MYRRNVILNDHLKTKNASFPWHASSSESLELELFVDPEPMLAYSEAFSVHPTNELPIMLQRENIFDFTGKRKLEVLITPSVIKSDESLKALQSSDRLCYFADEHKLRFFKVYTKHNCEVECISNIMREFCNCTYFSFIRDTETRVCGIALDEKGIHIPDYQCFLKFYDKFGNFKPTAELNSCSCLSTCDSVNYNIEIRESKLQGTEWDELELSLFKNYFRNYLFRFDNITLLSFKFTVEETNPLRRTRRFTIIDFLSYVGGVFGLFAGISVLSFFEIVYFFTLRVVSNIFLKEKSSQHSIVIVKSAE